MEKRVRFVTGEVREGGTFHQWIRAEGEEVTQLVMSVEDAEKLVTTIVRSLPPAEMEKLNKLFLSNQ